MLTDLELENRELRAKLSLVRGTLAGVIAFLEIPHNRVFRFRKAHKLLLTTHDMVAETLNPAARNFSLPAGYTAWLGGSVALPCPVEKGALVNLVYRDGMQRFNVKALHFSLDDTNKYDASYSHWRHFGLPGDIVGWQFS